MLLSKLKRLRNTANAEFKEFQSTANTKFKDFKNTANTEFKGFQIIKIQTPRSLNER